MTLNTPNKEGDVSRSALYLSQSMRLDRISSPRRVVGALKCFDVTHLFAFHHSRSLLITSRVEPSLHHRKYIRHRTDFHSLILVVGYLICIVCVVVRQCAGHDMSSPLSSGNSVSSIRYMHSRINKRVCFC